MNRTSTIKRRGYEGCGWWDEHSRWHPVFWTRTAGASPAWERNMTPKNFLRISLTGRAHGWGSDPYKRVSFLSADDKAALAAGAEVVVLGCPGCKGGRGGPRGCTVRRVESNGCGRFFHRCACEIMGANGGRIIELAMGAARAADGAKRTAADWESLYDELGSRPTPEESEIFTAAWDAVARADRIEGE